MNSYHAGFLAVGECFFCILPYYFRMEVVLMVFSIRDHSSPDLSAF